MTIQQKALEYCTSKLGCRYSQSDRMKENVYDCSSLIFRSYKDAGYLFQTYQNTSCYLVYDTGFDLIYPESVNDLGKQLTSIEAQTKGGYVPEAGDVVFFRTSSKRDSFNKITHVAMVESDKTMIHARGVEYGVIRTSIHLYGASVVAIIRLKDELNAKDKPAKLAICTGDDVNIREKPNGQIFCAVNKGHPLVVSGESKWLRVTTLVGDKAVDGFIFEKYVGEKN